MGKKYPEVQTQSMIQSKFTENNNEHCRKQKKGSGGFARVKFTQNSLFSFLVSTKGGGSQVSAEQ